MPWSQSRFAGTWQKFTRPNVSSEMSSAAERQQSSEACSDHATDSVVELMGALREQMEMELENTNIELHVDTCRHLLTITE